MEVSNNSSPSDSDSGHYEIPVDKPFPWSKVIKGVLCAVSILVAFAVGGVVLYFFIPENQGPDQSPFIHFPTIQRPCPPNVEANIDNEGEIECLFPSSAASVIFSQILHNSDILQIAEIICYNSTDDSLNYTVSIHESLVNEITVNVTQLDDAKRKTVLKFHKNHPKYTGLYTVSTPNQNLSVTYRVNIPGIMECANEISSKLWTKYPVNIYYKIRIIGVTYVQFNKLGESFLNISFINSSFYTMRTNYDANMDINIIEDNAKTGLVTVLLEIKKNGCSYAGDYEMIFNGSYGVYNTCKTLHSVESGPEKPILNVYYGGFVERTPVNLSCEAKPGCYDVNVRLQKKSHKDGEYFDFAGWAIVDDFKNVTSRFGNFTNFVHYEFKYYQVTAGLDGSFLRCLYTLPNGTQMISRPEFNVQGVSQDFCDGKKHGCQYFHPKCKPGVYISCMTQPYEQICNAPDISGNKFEFGIRPGECEGTCDFIQYFGYGWKTCRN